MSENKLTYEDFIAYIEELKKIRPMTTMKYILPPKMYKYWIEQGWITEDEAIVQEWVEDDSD